MAARLGCIGQIEVRRPAPGALEAKALQRPLPDGALRIAKMIREDLKIKG
jgi:hypothetical protein